MVGSTRGCGDLATTDAPVLRVSGISKTYGNVFTTGNIRALDNVSFELSQGEICGLVGPNGAGKSTLLRVIMGIDRSNAGEVHFGPLAGRVIGFLPDRPIFYEDVSAYHNLLFFARLARVDAPEATSHQALRDFGLAERRNDPVSTYSKGMRQRLSMARAVLHRPTLLLMDEPFSGFDPTMMIELREVFKRLKAEGMTMFLSSHELNEIDQVCDTILFIDKGKVVRKEALEEERVLDVQVVLAGSALDAKGALSRWPLISESEEDRSLVLRMERKEIPEMVASLVSSGAKVEEIKIVRRKAEERYAEIFLREGRR